MHQRLIWAGCKHTAAASARKREGAISSAHVGGGEVHYGGHYYTPSAGGWTAFPAGKAGRRELRRFFLAGDPVIW